MVAPTGSYLPEAGLCVPLEAAMQFHDATADDVRAIREVARRSLLESYAALLSEDTILDAVDQWFSDERLQDLLEEDERVFLPVATVGDEAVAFAQCHLVETPERVGEIHWLHVDPDHRHKGVGQALMDHVVDRFHELGVDRLKGLVFAKNEVGCDFFEANGFDLAYTHTQTVAGRSFTENVYVKVPSDEPWRTELEPVETPDGRELYVAYNEASIGADGPFHVAYLDTERERRYGWFCSACRDADTAMDPMGRVVCNRCGNVRKATRWDAAYL